MKSSANIPHIYSPRAEHVAASDWNAYMALNTPVSIDNTDSPYDLEINVGVLIVDTTAGDVTVNLPAGGQHGYKIKNIGIGTITLVPSGAETIEEQYVYPNESAQIEFIGGWYWV